MNSLQLEEEAIILGQPYAAYAILDPVTVGDTITTIVTPPNNGSPVTYAYQIVSGDTGQSIAYKLAANIQLLLSNVFVTASNLLSPAQLSFRSPIGTFLVTPVVTRSGGTPSTIIVQAANGSSYPTPQYQITDSPVTMAYGLLPVCDALETQLLNAAQNMSYSDVGSTATGAATFRKDELIVRSSMLQRYRHDLGVMLSFFQPDQVSGIPSFGIEV
jgi:hypothetical protein